MSNRNQFEVPTGKAKMWAAAIGGTITAVGTFVATLNVAFENNGVDVGEVSLILGAVIALVSMIRAVWAVENRPL